MTATQWALILILAFGAFGVRLLGLLAGDRIHRSRFAYLLEDLPGLIIVALVAASLAGAPPAAWIAALLALAIAVATNHVIITMVGGAAAYAALSAVLT